MSQTQIFQLDADAAHISKTQQTSHLSTPLFAGSNQLYSKATRFPAAATDPSKTLYRSYKTQLI
ncbi:hypothetical protein BCEP4_1140074 [Burkholderia cepacia]|nr:hypothetical protein BCEP4_1140074 [Burkholderia cepacia]